MKLKDLKVMDIEKLAKLLSSLREQQRDLSFKIHSKEVKNSHLIGNVKKDIARILTLINQDKHEK